MSFIQRLGLEEENIVVTDTLVDLPEASVDPDTSDAVMTDNDDNLDMTSQALETMGDFIKVQHVAYKSDGFDPHAAKLFKLATESMARQLGLSLANELPAMEHFESTHTTSAATRVSAESLGETVTKIFQAIIDTLKAVWDKICKFISGILSKAEAERVAQYRRVIDAETKKLDGVDKKAKQDKPLYITNLELIKTFSIPGHGADDASVRTIMDNTLRYAEFLAELGKEYSYVIDSFTEALIRTKECLEVPGVRELEDVNSAFMRTLNVDFNPKLIKLFEGTVKVDGEFDSSKLSQKPYDHVLLNTGFMGEGVRFAYYFPDASQLFVCEMVKEDFKLTSAHDTIMPVPELDTITTCSSRGKRIDDMLEHIHRFFYKEHKTEIEKMFKLLTTVKDVLKEVSHNLKFEQVDRLNDMMKYAGERAGYVIKTYNAIFVYGIASIEKTRKAELALHKAALSKYQEFASRSAT